MSFHFKWIWTDESLSFKMIHDSLKTDSPNLFKSLFKVSRIKRNIEQKEEKRGSKDEESSFMQCKQAIVLSG